jgi:hypothetical protein
MINDSVMAVVNAPRKIWQHLLYFRWYYLIFWV